MLKTSAASPNSIADEAADTLARPVSWDL